MTSLARRELVNERARVAVRDWMSDHFEGDRRVVAGELFPLACSVDVHDRLLCRTNRQPVLTGYLADHTGLRGGLTLATTVLALATAAAWIQHCISPRAPRQRPTDTVQR